MATYRDRLTAWRFSIDSGVDGNPIDYRGQANNFQMPTLLENFLEEPDGAGFMEKVFTEQLATLTATYELRTFSPAIGKLFGRPLASGGNSVWPTARFEARTASQDRSGHRIVCIVTGRIFGFEPSAAAADGTWTFPIQQDAEQFKLSAFPLTIAPATGLATPGAEDVIFDIDIPASKFLVGTYDKLAAVRTALNL